MKKMIWIFWIAVFSCNALAGDFVGGVFYTQAVKLSPKEITLVTNAVVLPNGLGLPAGAGWVFETATNNAFRHDGTLAYTSPEVGVLYNDSHVPIIFIYDWSCAVRSPCVDGSTEPSYQRFKSVSEEGVYIKTISRAGKNFKVLPYKNTTRQVLVNGELRWKNQVFFQTCSQSVCTWKLIYSHFVERGAVIGMVSNALFGPVIETYLPNPVPTTWKIPTLGFFGSKLIVDGKSYPLDSTVTEYRNPSFESNLVTSYQNPNISFLVKTRQ